MKRKASLSWKEKAVFVEGKQPFLFCLDIFHLEGSLFASQGIVATKLLEELGVEAQGLVVAPWVVHGEAGFCQVMGLDMWKKRHSASSDMRVAFALPSAE